MTRKFTTLLIVVILAIIASTENHLYEDGSYRTFLGNGCIPHQLCD